MTREEGTQRNRHLADSLLVLSSSPPFPFVCFFLPTYVCLSVFSCYLLPVPCPFPVSLGLAVGLLNQLSLKKFPLILNRVMTHLKEKTDEMFNQEEMAHLSKLYQLTSEQIHILLDSMSYIYEQAAYHLLNGDKLKAQLMDVLQIAEPQSAAIAYVWNEQREAYMINLRDRTFGSPQVRNRTSQHWSRDDSRSHNDPIDSNPIDLRSR